VNDDGPPPQFTYSIGNAGQPHIIYVSADPAANHLQVSLECSIDATLTPGPLVPQSAAGAAANSLFYLDLTPLGLDAAAFAALQVDPEGWMAQLFPGTGQLIGLTPAGKPIQLQAGVPITFKIGNFVLPAEPPGVSSLNLSIYNVAGVTKSALGIITASAVTFAAPPGGKADLGTALALSVTPADGIIVSIDNCPEVENRLTVTLSPVPDGPVALAGEATLFTLCVVYATDEDGFGALMNAGEGKNIGIPNPAGSGWLKTAIVDGLQGRSWQLFPTDKQQLPGAAGGPVSFDFGPIETFFQPGPTVLLLKYENVPGFADGAFAFTIQKLPHVVITSFSLDPAVSWFGAGPAAVTASWEVSNGATLILDIAGDSRDVSDLTSFTATISGATAFQLTASGAAPGGVDNIDIRQATERMLQLVPQLVPQPVTLQNLIWGVALSPTDPLFAVTTYGGATSPPFTCHLWIYLTGAAQPLQVVELAQGMVATPFFSADGTTLFVPGDGTIACFSVIPTADGYSIDPLPALPVLSPGWIPASIAAPDGSIYILSSDDPEQASALLILQQTSNGYSCSKLIDWPENNSVYMALTPDGRSLYVVSWLLDESQSILSIDLTQTPPSASVLLTTQTQITGIAVTADGGTLLVAAGDLAAYDLSSPPAPPIRTLALDTLAGVAVLPGCDYALIGTGRGVAILDCAQLRILEYSGVLNSEASSATSFAVTPDASQALALLAARDPVVFFSLPMFVPLPTPALNPRGPRPHTPSEPLITEIMS
jgi:hypothetical protein